jgi:hypothetical protein
VQPEVDLLLGSLFFSSSIAGLLTIPQLVRLRNAWHESARIVDDVVITAGGAESLSDLVREIFVV